jgi:hypothetical protein
MKRAGGIAIPLVLAGSLFSTSEECLEPARGFDVRHNHIETPFYPHIPTSSKIISGVTASGTFNLSSLDVSLWGG